MNFGAMGAMANEVRSPEKVGEIASAIPELESATKDIESVICQCRDRLTPLMRRADHPITENVGEKAMRFTTPLAAAIQERTIQLMCCTKALRSINEQIEL